MNKTHFDFLRRYSYDTFKVDRLLISAFIVLNNVEINHNRMLKDYLIQTTDDDFESLTVFANFLQHIDFEHLIELFEFVVSPSDKVINGAVYTPDYIREYIVSNCLNMFPGQLDNVRTADISCGCGGFLLAVTQQLRELTGRTLFEIFRDNIYGIDIAEYSIQRTKLLLCLFAVTVGEDIERFQFNLYVDNSLSFDWRGVCPEILGNDGFDIIIGNPPYVCSRNMDQETLIQVQEWEVAGTGHPDLYIPFFQIGLELLNVQGVLGYITVNTFIKSINGRALRAYFERENISLTLLNFGGEQVFADRNTYTCICFLRKGIGGINYIRTESSALAEIDLDNLHRFEYRDLNNQDGWTLVNDQNMLDFLNVVENTGLPFKDLYNTKNGIATLKNDVYKFRPVRSDENFHYLNDGVSIFPIERAICKRIVNANKIKVIDDIERLMEQIIFPYDLNTNLIAEELMATEYPNAFAYLETKRQILATRDKGARTYEAWYAYGRRQSMDIHAYKLFFPHICERPTFVICEEQDLLFYNGIALISNNLRELIVIKKVLESDLFFKYITNSTKDYASGYISMSRNYLKNFGIYQFSDEQKQELLALDDVNQYLEELYQV